MNKKLNYVLFIVAATVVNIIIIGLLIIIPLILLRVFLGDTADSIYPIVIAFLPLLAIIGGYFIYTKLYMLFREKVNMEKYFEPIFKRKR
jgi:ABC-type Na+ efflux pump permease subunit